MNWTDLVDNEIIKVGDILLFEGKTKSLSAVVRGKHNIFCEAQNFCAKRPSKIWHTFFKANSVCMCANANNVCVPMKIMYVVRVSQESRNNSWWDCCKCRGTTMRKLRHSAQVCHDVM